MIISDLSHLEILSKASEADAILGGAGTTVTTTASASGITTYTDTQTRATAIMLPSGGSVSYSFGQGIAYAVDPYDPSASTTASGTAQGDITVVVGANYDVDVLNRAYAGSITVALAVNLPEYARKKL